MKSSNSFDLKKNYDTGELIVITPNELRNIDQKSTLTLIGPTENNPQKTAAGSAAPAPAGSAAAGSDAPAAAGSTEVG